MNRKFLLSMLILLTLYGYMQAALGLSNPLFNTTHVISNAGPVIKITSPKTGDKFKYGKLIYAEAEASDANATVQVVEFFFEGYLVGRDSVAPYSTEFFGYPVAANGILKAVVTNMNGLKSADSITISVAYNESPTIKILNPAPGAVIKANETVTIEADATDTDGTILAVYFWIDNNYVGASYTPPYRFDWKATEGAVPIAVTAIDNDYAQTSEQIDLIVGKADFSVKIKEPNNGTVFSTGDTVTVKADVVSLQPVNSVEFFVNDQSIAVDAIPPFSASFTVKTGISKVLAIASSGGKTTADSVFIKANNPAVNQLPFVRILDGYNGEIVKTGSTVNIDTRASDPDGSVTEVEFFVNGLSIGVDRTAPFSYVWKAVEGLAEITAVPTDNTGTKGKESNVLRIQVSPVYSRLKIIEPREGTVYKPGNKIKIEAFNNCLESYVTYTRSRVQFRVNDKNLGTVMKYPYTVDWIAEKGKAVIQAIAKDNLDEVIDSVTILVDDGNQNLPPVVSLKRPYNGATIDPGKTVSIEASAKDADGTIKSVSFFVNNVLLGRDSIAPYTTTWLTQAGAAVVKAVAVDNQGAVTADSCKINVIKNTAPVIEIMSPANGDVLQLYHGVDIETKVSDAEGQVSTVEFYENNKLYGTDSQEPFQIYWSTSAPGKKVLKVIATDDKGLKSSDSVTVQVEAPLDSVNVKIKSPQHFASYNMGDIVKLEAEASAVSPAKVDYVEFQINDSIELYDYTAPYTADWTATDQGVVKLEVFAAYNNHLDMDTDSIFVRESDFDVQIISPTKNSDAIATGRSLTIEALASDANNKKIKQVEFFVEGVSVGSDATMPYTAVWPGQGQPGRILIVAVATNLLGEQVSDTVIVNVTPAAILVKITNPLNGQELNAGDPVTINAQVSQYNVVEYHVCHVEFFVNDVSIGYESKTTASNPFQTEWIPKKGYAVIKAVAWSWNGIAKDSIVVKVNDPVTNDPPTITLNSPLDGAIYQVNDNIDLEADAFDTDGYVKKVVFYVHDAVGQTLSFTDTVAPYACDWIPKKAGQYTVNAKATDDLGAEGSSLTVNVYVTPVTAIASVDADQWVSVYPNPAKDQLTIETNEQATVQLLAADGRVVIQPMSIQANQKHSLAIEQIANGTYILNISNANYSSFKRILINR